MRSLNYIPKILGRPFYPDGFPLHFQNESWIGRNRDMLLIALKNYYNFYTGEEPEPSKIDEQVLTDYLVYYINAPCWKANPYGIGGLDNLIKRADNLKTNEDVHDFIGECLEFGLDPF